jgi:hypothetical protein
MRYGQFMGGYRVVLIPEDQVEDAGPGLVRVTGTPGAGVWDWMGPYRALGELTVDPAALNLPAPVRPLLPGEEVVPARLARAAGVRVAG